MIPKLETAIAAVEAGVESVVILDGRRPHAMLVELFTEHGAGTLVQSVTSADLRHVDTWLFDLDNTLYPLEMRPRRRRSRRGSPTTSSA